jgi:DNA-binding phage protein
MTPAQFDAALRKAIEADPRTVNQLAIDAGVEQSSLHRYLYAPDRNPKWSTVRALLSHLGFKLIAEGEK